MKLGWIRVLLGVGLAACSAPSEFPNMLEGETGRVVRIIDGDSLVLNGGQIVRLVGVEAPRLGRRGEPDDVHAQESARLLENLVLGRQVQLFYPGPTRDRYDRALAHLVTRDPSGPPLWVNLAVLERGGAWVRLYQDTAAQADRLLAGERAARASRRGIWSEATYQPIRVDAISEDLDTRFRLIWARLGADISTLSRPWNPPLACARELDLGNAALGVRPSAAEICELPQGTAIELRTLVSDTALMVTHAKHVRVLSPVERETISAFD